MTAQNPHYIQKHQHQHHSRTIIFIDIPGYITLLTDLHINTVLSDGRVWPGNRVEEALKDNLDAGGLKFLTQHFSKKSILYQVNSYPKESKIQ